MSTVEQKALIFEYWCRVLLESDIAVNDISKITAQFADDYDEFVPSLCHQFLKVEKDSKSIYKTRHKNSGCNAFGNVIAKIGNKYHWKCLVIDVGKDKQLNIGIVPAGECTINNLETYFWNKSYGYSYHANSGRLWNGGREIEPSKECTTYGNGDIIDMWLDLREDVNELTFAKNGTEIDKTKIHRDAYKLAIGLYGNEKKLELLSFDIQYVCVDQREMI